LADGHNLLKRLLVLSKDFKTANTYTFQPIDAPKEVYPFLRMYFEVIPLICITTHALRNITPWCILYMYYNMFKQARKWVIAKLEDKQMKENLSLDGSPLFLNHNGGTLDCSKQITKTIHRFSLHMTSNSIRRLVETETDVLASRGHISDAQQQAIHNLNGHSKQTAKRHYIYTKSRTAIDARVRDAALGNSVMDAIIAGGKPSPNRSPNRNSTQQVPVSVDVNEVSEP